MLQRRLLLWRLLLRLLLQVLLLQLMLLSAKRGLFDGRPDIFRRTIHLVRAKLARWVCLHSGRGCRCWQQPGLSAVAPRRGWALIVDLAPVLRVAVHARYRGDDSLWRNYRLTVCLAVHWLHMSDQWLLVHCRPQLSAGHDLWSDASKVHVIIF